MVESIGTLSSDVGVQLVVGATTAASLGAFGWAWAMATPRPCWTKRHGCLLKVDNPDVCAGCIVYLRANDPAYRLRAHPDLGQIERLAVIGAGD